MSRRRVAEKKNILPDTLYGSVVVAKMINYVMLHGKKSIAEVIVYGAISNLATKVKKDAIECFREVLSNLKPLVEVKSRRVGGATYQVPTEIRDDRSLSLSLKWLVDAAKKRKSEKSMLDSLSAELVDAYNKRGFAYKKREDTHKMAEANKAFSYFRW